MLISAVMIFGDYDVFEPEIGGNFAKLSFFLAEREKSGLLALRFESKLHTFYQQH